MNKQEIRNSIEVKSRTEHITDEDELRIVDFICEYSFKDTKEIYTNGAILVPLFRVMDALNQKGKPYCSQLNTV